MAQELFFSSVTAESKGGGGGEGVEGGRVLQLRLKFLSESDRAILN